MPKILHSLLPKSLHFWLPFTYGLRYHGLPEGADASFFLCKELISGYLTGITGEYATPRGYFVNESECELFDKQFPPKQKQKLPGQLW